METLASAGDVALALGLEDEFAFSDSQRRRVDGLLERVSRRFRIEAERPFTPGTETVRLLAVAGKVRLPEQVTDVTSVTASRGTETLDLDYVLEGQTLVCEYAGCPVPTGVSVTVTYTHSAEVPAAVVADVAAIVARHLSVEADEAKVVSETAGPYTTRYAEWVGSTGLFTEDECRTARSYRYPASTVVVHKP